MHWTNAFAVIIMTLSGWRIYDATNFLGFGIPDNAVQKVLYVSVMFAILAVTLSGLVLFKSVQFPLLRELMFGYEGARRVHFIAMTFLTGFFIVHVFMSLLVPKSLKAMITGA